MISATSVSKNIVCLRCMPSAANLVPLCLIMIVIVMLFLQQKILFVI